MNILKKITLIGMLIVFSAVITACDKPGSAETTGKKIDETTEKMGEAILAEPGTAETAGKKIDETAEKAGEVIGDSAITAKVKAAILAEPGLRSLQISVNTAQGVATLSGAVDSQQDIDRAEEIASTVAGVKSVKNQLALK